MQQQSWNECTIDENLDPLGRSSQAEVRKAKGPNGEDLAVKRIDDIQRGRNEFTRAMECQSDWAVRLVCSNGSNMQFQQQMPSDLKLQLGELKHTKRNLMMLSDTFGGLQSRSTQKAYVSRDLVRNIIPKQLDTAQEFFKRSIWRLLKAVKAIHDKGFVHRDIKPANIWVDEDGLSFLGDFGSANLFSNDINPKGGSTLFQEAPETFGPVDQARYCFTSDIQQVGMTIVELLTNRLPWNGNEQSTTESVSNAMENSQDASGDLLFSKVGLADMEALALKNPESEMALLKQLIQGVTTKCPIRRMNADAALASPYFACYEKI